MRDGEDKLPSCVLQPERRQVRPLRGLRVILAGALSLAALQYLRLYAGLSNPSENVQVPLHAAAWLEKCQRLTVKPGPPADFNTRIQSDRFVPGTKPTLITVSLLSWQRQILTRVVLGCFPSYAVILGASDHRIRLATASLVGSD